MAYEQVSNSTTSIKANKNALNHHQEMLMNEMESFVDFDSGFFGNWTLDDVIEGNFLYNTLTSVSHVAQT